MVSQILLKELQEILRDDYNITPGKSDIELLANNLVGIFLILVKTANEAEMQS
jgi:hypothetical protein